LQGGPGFQECRRLRESNPTRPGLAAGVATRRVLNRPRRGPCRGCSKGCARSWGR
jgi:hypothetical protein